MANENNPDFRAMSTVLCRKDFVNPDDISLRKVRDRYESCEEYLETLFYLYREEMVSTLRDGVARYKLNGCIETDKDALERYFVVSVQKTGGMQVDYSDFIEHFRVLRLSTDINFIGDGRSIGVCMSDDNFRTDFHCGFILNKPIRNADGLYLDVYFYENEEIKKNGSYQLTLSNSWEMEAYTHTLKCLQAIVSHIPKPMELYVVRGCQEVMKPAYLRPRNEPLPDEYQQMMEFYESSQVDTSGEVKQEKLGVLTVDGQEISTDKLVDRYRPTKLDEDQRLAVCQALTQELCVISGPPLTGKTTIVATEIVRILLQNRNRFTNPRPILLMAYSNPELDALLEAVHNMIKDQITRRILKHKGPTVCRLGCGSDERNCEERLVLNQVLWDHRRLGSPENRESSNANHRRKNELFDEISSCAVVIQDKSILFCMECFKEEIDSEHVQQLTSFAREIIDNKQIDADEALGCWLSDIKRNGDMIIPSPTDNMTHLARVEEERNLPIPLIEESDAKMFETERTWQIVQDLKHRKKYDLLNFFSPTTETKHLNPLLRYEIWKTLSRLQHVILDQRPMLETEARTVDDIWNLSVQKRWSLYAYWRQKMVVAVTTTGAAKFRRKLDRIQSQIVIIDGAQQVCESQMAACIMNKSVQHAILLGTHPYTQFSPCVNELVAYNAHISMFERLIGTGFPVSQLRTQYHIHPLITNNILVPHIYPEPLEVKNPKPIPPVEGLAQNVFFWDHDHTGKETAQIEADMVVNLVDFIIQQKQYEENDIWMLGYSAEILKRAKLKWMKKEDDWNMLIKVENMCLVHDDARRKRKKVVVLSLNFSESDVDNFEDFAMKHILWLTRAEQVLYMVGNSSELRKVCRVWSNILDTLQKNKLISKTSPIPSFDTNCGDCSVQCEHMSCGRNVNSIKKWERSCSQVCVLCTELCKNVCSHRRCMKRCFEICDVDECNEPCEKSLPCGHPCLGLCSEICPDICFACHKDRCLSVLGLKLEDSSMPRIMQLPCRHLKSVKEMDNVVTEQMKNSAFLSCPEKYCGQSLALVRRYQKQFKEYVLKRHDETVAKLSTSISPTLDDSVKKQLEKSAHLVSATLMREWEEMNSLMQSEPRDPLFVHFYKKYIQYLIEMHLRLQDNLARRKNYAQSYIFASRYGLFIPAGFKVQQDNIMLKFNELVEWLLLHGTYKRLGALLDFPVRCSHIFQEIKLSELLGHSNSPVLTKEQIYECSKIYKKMKNEHATPRQQLEACETWCKHVDRLTNDAGFRLPDFSEI